MKKLLSNPYVIIALVIIALLLVLAIYRNGPRWWAQATKRDQGNYDNPRPNEEREAELKQLARDLYAAMDGASVSGGVAELLQRAYGLNDTELRYVAEQFEQIGDGDSLSVWIDDEVFSPWENIDSLVISRLSNMNL